LTPSTPTSSDNFSWDKPAASRASFKRIDGFITRCYENPQCAQLPYTFMLRKVLDSLDVIVSIDLDGNVRRMNDIYFRPIHRNQYFEEMKA
jgi:type IV secretion system protein VirB11